MRKLFLFVLPLLLSFSLFGYENTKTYVDKQIAEFSEDKIPSKEVNNLFFDNKSIIVWGTHSDDEDEVEINEMIAYNVVDFRIKRWLGKPENVVSVIIDNELTIEQVENYNLILVGSPNSNIWLGRIIDLLPIQITEDEIKILDKTFEGDEVGVSFRYPNPLNLERQVWVVSAPSYEALRFIPKTEEYSIYELTDYNPNADRFLELAQGNFEENWNLTSVKMIDNIEVYSGEDDTFNVVEIKEYPPPEWAENGVMYEIFVRSFFDSNDDGIGDLRGITKKLDYLNDGDPETNTDLGIKLIWLMPIFDSPSYHCYDVKDYYNINPDYGTNEDFRELLREAHKRGIKIVTDLVLNHCSSQHEFFLDAYSNPESKYGDWFFFTNESHTRAHNWQFRHRKKDRAMLEPYMPAWNVNNPEVQRYLFDMAKYWMDPNKDGNLSDGIDGFRCDYVKGPPHEFWKNFRQEVKAVNQDFLLIAENWDGLGSIAQSFDNEFDMAIDFPFQGSLIASITSGNATDFKDLLKEQERILPDHAMMNRFFNNHDMNRIFTRLDEDLAKLGLTLLLTVPQMPMLYYGDEIGMKGEKDPYDEGIRRPMEWCSDNKCEGMTSWYPVWDEEPDGISVEEEINDPESILNYVKELIHLREKYPLLETGKIKFVPVYDLEDFEEKKEYRRAVSYLISGGYESILIIANLYSEKDLVIDLSEFREPTGMEEILGSKIIKSEYYPYLKIKCPKRSSFVFNIKYD
jgi:glycosidase